MRLPLSLPAALLRAPAQAAETVEQLWALLPSLVRMVADAEDLIGEVRAVVRDVMVTRETAQSVAVAVEVTREHAHAVADRAGDTVSHAADAVHRAAAVIGTAEDLMAAVAPALSRLAPVADRVAAALTPDVVAALVKVVQTTPELLERVGTEVLPMLATLGTVAPDVRELVETATQLNEMFGHVPGMGRVKKRLEDQAECDNVGDDQSLQPGG